MKNYIFSIVIAVISISTAYSQQDSISKTKGKFFGSFESNGQWYTNDVNRKIQHPTVPLRSNNYLSLNYNYGRFTMGTQVESYVNEALLNFNPLYRKTDLGTYYLKYKSKKVEVTIGHFYEQFGSGLALRSWEDRALGINNAIRGVRVNYDPIEGINLTGLYGRHRVGFHVGDGDIFGFNSDFNISKLTKMNGFDLSYGFSFVGRSEKLPTNITNINETTTVFSNRIEFTKNAFYLNSEYVFKSKDAIILFNNLNYDFVKPGNALLLNFGYSKKGLGFDASVRRIENMQFLSERKLQIFSPENTSINYNDRIMNFVPSLTKQHHSNLANIYVYQAQNQVVLNESTQTNKSGEIGGQFDVFYDFKKGSTLGGKYGTKIALNVAKWYDLKASYRYVDENDNYKPNYEAEFLGSKEKYFSDYNIEITKKLSSKVKGIVSYINQNYNDRNIRGIFQESLVRTNILMLESTIIMPKSKSLTIAAEHMWADADRKNWLGGTLEYNHNANWSIFVMDMYNYGFDDKTLTINETDLFDIHFYNFGTSYKKGSTRIALNYGRQRGGLVCAGGVCRFVPPSTGLGLQITTSF
jgi:hypothetical protein